MASHMGIQLIQYEHPTEAAHLSAFKGIKIQVMVVKMCLKIKCNHNPNMFSLHQLAEHPLIYDPSLHLFVSVSPHL